MATPHVSCFPADLTCLSVKHSSAVHSAHRARLPSHLLKTKFKSCFSLRTFSWLPIAVQVRAKPLFLAECTIGLRPLHAQPSWPLTLLTSLLHPYLDLSQLVTTSRNTFLSTERFSERLLLTTPPRGVLPQSLPCLHHYLPQVLGTSWDDIMYLFVCYVFLWSRT